MLVVKLDQATENGVRWRSSLIGIRGSLDQYTSVRTKAVNPITLVMRSPQTQGCEKGNSSADFRVRPNSNDATPMVSVSEPR